MCRSFIIIYFKLSSRYRIGFFVINMKKKQSQNLVIFYRNIKVFQKLYLIRFSALYNIFFFADFIFESYNVHYLSPDLKFKFEIQKKKKLNMYYSRYRKTMLFNIIKFKNFKTILLYTIF